MNVSLYVPTVFREKLLTGALDFDTNAFEAFLVRSGFTFLSSSHHLKKNFKPALTDTMTFTASTGTITDTGSGDFSTEGFIVGGYIMTNHANAAGVYVIRTVASKTLTVALVSGSAMVDLSPATSVAVTGHDEYPDATNGYDRTPNSPYSVTFRVDGNNLYLNTVALADGDNIFGNMDLFDASNVVRSPGFIVCKTTGNYDVACYAKFSDWRISY